MFCCGGAEEENFSPPASQYTAPPNRNTYGNDRESSGPNFARNGAPQKALPIEIPALTLAELNRLTGNFGQKALIGEGSYGRVFYATLSSGQAAAIKKLDPSSSQEPDSEFAAQIPIAHRDVRSSNVFLFDGYTAKMSDFNLTNQSPDTAARLRSTRVLGTFGYHAPEYAMTGQITLKSDVYSFGVVLLELLTGRKPVDHTMPKGQQSLVTWATPRLSEDKVHQCVDPKLNKQYPPKAVAKLAAIAALCVQYEADFRSNMTIVMKAIHPFLNSKPAGSDFHM